MPKKKRKGFKNKKAAKRMFLPSLSKREASSNWFNFLKSTGLKSKLPYTMNPEEVSTSSKKEKPPSVTSVVALDCEMVADVNDKPMLARVSIVNYKLQCIYDKHVKPTAAVADYRTRFSGIREEDVANGTDFEIVQKEVRDILLNKILVGHSLYNDFRVLKFSHHKQLIRDTALYPPFAELCGTGSPSLKKLAKLFLDENIQTGEHCSVEDAKTAMKLYKKFNKDWEKFLVKGKSSQEGENCTNNVNDENK